MNKSPYTVDDAHDALLAIPAGLGIDEWAKVSLAAKVAGIGFEAWHTWCANADNYPGEKQCGTHWRSLTPNGAVTPGTLFFYARNYGWKPKGRESWGAQTTSKPTRGGRTATPATRGEIRTQADEEAMRVDPNRVKKRDQLWELAGPPVATHPYLARKQIAHGNMRQINSAAVKKILEYAPKAKDDTLIGELLVVPMRDVHGDLVTLELIDERGRKAALYGLPRIGNFWTSDPAALDEHVVSIGFAEGVATASSLELVVGHPVIACGSWNNTENVVKAVAAKYPGADLVMFPDRGERQEAKAAELASRFIARSVPLPRTYSNGADYNDQVIAEGIYATRLWIAHVLRERTKRVSFVNAKALGRVAIDEILVGLPRGTIGLIVGQGAVGKTMLAMQVSAGLALGRDLTTGDDAGEPHFLSPPVETPRKVALILGEDSHDQLHNRLVGLIDAFRFNDSEVHQIDQNLRIYALDGDDMRVISMGRDRQPEPGPLLEGLNRVAAWADLVILDPLVRLSDFEENDNAAASALMLAIAQAAKGSQCAMIILHHVPKSAGANGSKGDWRMARGAAAYSTSSRWQVVLMPVDDELGSPTDDVHIRLVKHNYTGPKAPFGLRRGPAGVLRFDWRSQPARAANGESQSDTPGPGSPRPMSGRDLVKRISRGDSPFDEF